MTPTQIKRKYEKRALTIVGNIRDAIIAAIPDASVSLPWSWTGDDDPLKVSAVLGEEPDQIDITLTFCMSENWDGERGGVNFSVDVVHESGRMIGGLTPYNYSDLVWAPRKDAEAIEARFRILEEADASELAQLIKDWIQNRKGEES